MVRIHYCIDHIHIGTINIRLEEAEENISRSRDATYDNGVVGEMIGAFWVKPTKLTGVL